MIYNTEVKCHQPRRVFLRLSTEPDDIFTFSHRQINLLILLISIGMSLLEREPSTTLFGNSPSSTYPASQGSILLYQDASCSSPLSNEATPLISGECSNMPINGILGVEIASLPTCGDYGTPILIVSNELNCANASEGTGADSGVIGKCQAYSSGVDIGSAQFICYGSGISAATTLVTTTSAADATYTTASSSSEEGDDNGPKCCCCCCVVM